MFQQALDYAFSNSDKFVIALQQHLLLLAVPLLIAIAVGLPLGLWSARSKTVSTIVINSFNALRVIPSLAVLFLAIPILGLSFASAAVALTLLAMPPVLISTDVAFRNINPAVREAATGMGMASGQILRQIEIPLALPVIISGIKTATVEVIASATLAAFVGAGGLGDFIVLGFAAYDPAILLVGAVPVALLALIAEVSLSWTQRSLQPPALSR
ncbi:MAG: ABC transporter permease [Cyanobacteria bacterium P01_C01_bin.120]